MGYTNLQDMIDAEWNRIKYYAEHPNEIKVDNSPPLKDKEQQEYEQVADKCDKERNKISFIGNS